MAVPKRKMSRSNTRTRRSQWKARIPNLVKSSENGQTIYSRPHHAKIVHDTNGVPLYFEYKGRRIINV